MLDHCSSCSISHCNSPATITLLTRWTCVHVGYCANTGPTKHRSLSRTASFSCTVTSLWVKQTAQVSILWLQRPPQPYRDCITTSWPSVTEPSPCLPVLFLTENALRGSDLPRQLKTREYEVATVRSNCMHTLLKSNQAA